MADHDYGSKGFWVMLILAFIFLLFSIIIYVYFGNWDSLPEVG